MALTGFWILTATCSELVCGLVCLCGFFDDANLFFGQVVEFIDQSINVLVG
jgi:hypothetical protein